MKAIWLRVKKYWWLLVAGLLTGLMFLVRKRPEPSTPTHPKPTNLRDRAKEEAAAAQVDIKINQARREAVTERQKIEVEIIQSEPDTRERAKMIARWIDNNL